MRKYWKTYSCVIALIAPCIFAGKVRAEELPEYEIYPGANNAVAEVTANQPGLATYLAHRETTQDDEAIPSRQTTCGMFRGYVGGFSHHNTGGKKNTNHQQNFGLGGAFVPYCDMWVHPIVQYMHVFVNSKHGTTDLAAVGVEGCLKGLMELCATYSRTHGRASDNRNRAASGKANIPSLSLGKGCYRVHYSPIAPRVTYVFISFECLE